MDNEKYIHRVGTVTFGCCMIIVGVLFLIKLFVPDFSIELVFRFWPCMFILLGVEILLANARNAIEFVYDKAGIFLMIILFCFAMCLAWVEQLMLQGYLYIY